MEIERSVGMEIRMAETVVEQMWMSSTLNKSPVKEKTSIQIYLKITENRDRTTEEEKKTNHLPATAANVIRNFIFRFSID